MTAVNHRSNRFFAMSLVGVIATVALAIMPLSNAAAAPVVGNGTATYTEQEGPRIIGEGVTVSSTGLASSYGGGYVDFEVTDIAAAEFLSLKEDAAPVVTLGTVSIVASSVYLGNGTTADIIGGVDPVLDGTAGKVLRVNFTSPFVNPSFEDGTTVGWTTMNQWVNLGVTVIAGHVSKDTSNYVIPTGKAGRTAPANDDVPPVPTGGSYGNPLWITETTGADVKHGLYSLRLQSSMTTARECDVVHGPAAHSSAFEAAAGDSIFFDWKAFASEDWGHVFGYIVNVETGVQTEVLDTVASAGTSSWTEVETIIPADGSYQFVFVSGTFDYTCGTKAGASLLIDNVRVYGSKVTDAVVDSVVAKLQYENVSDTPETVRNVNVTAADNSGGVGAGTITVAITPVDDAPTLAAVTGIDYSNTDGRQTYASASGTLVGADPDGTIVYGVSGGVADAKSIAGKPYTHSVAGGYGSLHLNSANGDYIFVPDNDAVDAQLKMADETYTLVASSGVLSASTEFKVGVTVSLTAPSAPVITAAEPGSSRVNLEWTGPTWIGGSDVTGYRIEKSPDGGSTWVVVEADTGDPGRSYTATGLVNGDAVTFRVIAINAVGRSLPSNSVEATPLGVPSAVTVTDVASTSRTLTVSFLPPSDNGGAVITGYEYSLDGGATWRAASTTSSPFTIRDLVNGESYDLVMRAVNAAGAGAPGAPLPSEPSLAPIKTGSGSSVVAPGTSELVVDGVPSPVVTTTGASTWTAAGGGFTIELQGINADGAALAIDKMGRLLAMKGGSVVVHGTGFRPGSTVDVWLLDGTHLLGEATVAGDGSFTHAFRLPGGVVAGNNTIQINGVADSGALRSLSTGLVILAASAPAALAHTGADPSGALALAVFLMLAGVALAVLRPRRRRLHRA